MIKSFIKLFIISCFFLNILNASTNAVNQKLFELKTSQESNQKIYDEKIMYIKMQIIQKENELKELKNDFKILEEKYNKNNIDKERIKKDFQNYDNKIDGQNKRIEDLHSDISFWGIVFTLVGTLTAIIVIAFTLRFGSIATNEAKEELQKWIDEKADKEFKPMVDSYLAQIEDRAKNLFEKNEGLTQKLEDKIELLDKKNYTEEEKKELEEAADEIKLSKNERDYTFEDKYKIFVSKYVKRNYEDALKDLNILEKEELDDYNLLKVLWAKAITLAQLGRNEEEIKVYEEVIRRFEDSKDDEILKQVVNALYNKGVRLGEMGDYKESIKVYEEVVRRFEDSTDDKILEQVAKSLVNKGVRFEEMGKNEEAIKLYDKVIKRFEDSKDNSILEQVASALFNKGVTLGQMEKYEEEIKVYEEVIKRFEDSKENNILKSVASALYNKGVALGQMGENEEAIKLYDKVIKRFEDSKDDKILEQVSKALVNKGVALGQMGENKKEIEDYEKVIRRFEDSKNNSILEQVAMSLVNKGVRLGQMRENEEAIEVYDEVIKRFEDSKDNNILEQVIKALVNKTETNLILNKNNLNKDLDLYFELVKENKNDLIKYKMLQIFIKAKENTQEEEIEKWKEEFKDVLLKDWSFYELKTWASSFEDKEVKERLLRYIDIFEKHNESVEED